MASSDELRKDGWLYFKQDPQLGEIRGLDPWAVENGIHLIRTEEDGACLLYTSDAADDTLQV